MSAREGDTVAIRAAGITVTVPTDGDPAEVLAYIAAKAARGVTANIGDRDRAIGEVIAAWLAKHDAEVGAKALRDAADEAARFDRIGKTPQGQITDAEIDFYQASRLRELVHGDDRYAGAAVVATWLTARATTVTEVGADG